MKTNIILSLVIIFICFWTNSIYSQSITLDWAISTGGVSEDRCEDITTDIYGNVYLTGSFSGTVDFDPGKGVLNLTSSYKTLFIQKLDKKGNLIWVKTVGGTNDSQGNSINVDALGNVYVTGSFWGAILGGVL
ncbi:MAG: hypothetical protein GY810_20870 [Aureispira sp.]|nr:hypothetical protein [Aureispira sp.]